jgi:hypothetical protein
MAKGKRLRKSAGGELEMSKENGTALDDVILLPNVVVSDEAILLPNVTVSNEADAEPHVAATVEQNTATIDEAIGAEVVLQQISQLVSEMVLYHN